MILKDALEALRDLGQGMAVVQRAPRKGVAARLYPYELPELPPVSCQSLALITEADGSDRCVACLVCEKVCPSQVIAIERKRNPDGKGFVLERFDIDLVNCMYCAACVEACPVSAIVTIGDFELSTYDLQTLKADKEFLDAQGRRAKQWYSPKNGVEYRDEQGIVRAPLAEQPGGEAAMLDPSEARTGFEAKASESEQ
jgi:NADH-quinone oxidoreductase subunit I